MNEQNTFDSNIPLPDFRKRTVDKYRLSGMQVGQSKFISRAECLAQSSILSSAKKFHSADCKFAVREATENGILGNRIWRIK